MTRPRQAENLVKIGLFREEAHSKDEIAGCLRLAAGHLKVAKSDDFDVSVRFLNAYDAVFQVATAGLRAMNLRPSDRAGSRAQTIQALAWTLQVKTSIMPVLIRANQARGELAYGKSDRPAVGKRELDALLAAVQAILDKANQLLLPSKQNASGESKPA